MAERKRRQYGTGSISQRPDGKWVGRIEAGYTREGGRRRLFVMGKTEAEAKRLLRDKIRAIKEGAAGTAARTNIRAWAGEWLEMKQTTVRPKTWTGYRACVNEWIVPTIGHKRLDQMTPADVREVAAACRRAGRSSSTARQAHVVLVDMLKAATREGHAVPPRCLLVDAPSPGKGDRTALDLPDALALLKVAAGDPDGSRWVAGLLQGMRQGEVLGLTWPCVDLRAGVIDVSWQLQEIPWQHGCAAAPCGKGHARACPLRSPRVPDGFEMRPLDGAMSLTRPKTSSGQRIIPLVPWMLSSLKAWRRRSPLTPHDLVWPAPSGRPQTVKADQAAWVELQQRAGVVGPGGRPYKIHEMRHTTATLLAEAGVDPSVIQAILGHSTIATQAIYKTVRLDATRAALGEVAERLQLT